MPGEEALKQYQKDEVEAIILAADQVRCELSCISRNQTARENPQDEAFGHFPRGSMIQGYVKEILPKSAIITLPDDKIGHLHISEVSHDRVQDINDYLKLGENVEAKVIGFDRKNQVIQLSLKKEDAMADNQEDESTTLGDLFKGKIGD